MVREGKNLLICSARIRFADIKQTNYLVQQMIK